jgi:hypothetical protein
MGERSGTPDRVTKNSLVFEGESFNLSLMEESDLKNLESRLIQDKEVLSVMLGRKDLEEDLFGTGWKPEVKLKIRLRKRQLDAVQAEFIKRRKAIPPDDFYAFQAVFLLYGKEALQQVKDKARELRVNETSLFERDDDTIRREGPGLRKSMCGEKVPHPTKRKATDHIEEIKARGENTTNLNVYKC